MILPILSLSLPLQDLSQSLIHKTPFLNPPPSSSCTRQTQLIIRNTQRHHHHNNQPHRHTAIQRMASQLAPPTNSTMRCPTTNHPQRRRCTANPKVESQLARATNTTLKSPNQQSRLCLNHKYHGPLAFATASTMSLTVA
ncbi:unnamed protein product [Camellia sinensis]